jgi:hypothetical protein
LNNSELSVVVLYENRLNNALEERVLRPSDYIIMMEENYWVPGEGDWIKVLIITKGF